MGALIDSVQIVASEEITDLHQIIVAITLIIESIHCALTVVIPLEKNVVVVIDC